MSYKNKFGNTLIIGGSIDILSITWDSHNMDAESSHKATRYPVLLFTPYVGDTNTHYHIELDRKEVRKLRDWLNAFAEDVGLDKEEK